MSAEKVLKTLREGRPGTAMKSFSAVLSDQEMHLVADFVMSEFVRRKALNTRYHTLENGWPDHERRYGDAYPFVRGLQAVDQPNAALTAAQRRGRDLFRTACITCHEPESRSDDKTRLEVFPRSEQGCGVVCHADGSVEFPWAAEGEHAERGRRPSSPYEAHGYAPAVGVLSPEEKAGQTLYQQNCAFCHAMDGSGRNWIGAFLQPHARDLTALDGLMSHDDDALFRIVRNGIPGTSMPAWKPVMSDEDIRNIVVYIKKAFLTKTDGQARGNTRRN